VTVVTTGTATAGQSRLIGQRHQPAAHPNQVNQLVHFCPASAALSSTSLSAIAERVHRGHTNGVPGLDPPAERHLALALRELDRTTPAVVAFIDVVRERVAASARHGVREVAGQLVTTREIDSKRRQL